MEPEINLTLTRLETVVNIPRSQGLNVRNADESAFLDTSPTLRSADAITESHDLSTTGYLERLQEVAKTFPQKVNKHLEEDNSQDFTLLCLKVKEKLDESVIEDLEEQIFTKLDKHNIFKEEVICRNSSGK